jgi:VWFA-related protein
MEGGSAMRTSRGSWCFIQVLLVFALGAFALIGCSGGGGSSSGGGSSGSPDISVSPTQLDFGNAVIDGQPSVRSVTVQNTGTAALAINQIAQPSAPFTIVPGTDTCSGASLAPGGTCGLTVQFSPTEQTTYTGTLNIASNDSDENPAAVALNGTGWGLGVSINRIDLDECPKLKVLVTVTDANGDTIPGLAKSNFQLFENGLQIDQSQFDLTNPPLLAPISVSLVMDYSSSMGPPPAGSGSIPDLQTAAISFLDQLDFPSDDAEIIKFNSAINVSQAFTHSKTELVSGVNDGFLVAEGTRLFDAVGQAVDDTALRSNIRKAVIAMSDGLDDLSSIYTLDTLIAHAVDKGIPVFTIGLGTVNATQMQRLATETGGQYFFAPTSGDLTDIYLQIAQILSDQYLITYTTSSSGAKTVKVHVTNGTLEGEDSRQTPGC